MKTLTQADAPYSGYAGYFTTPEVFDDIEDILENGYNTCIMHIADLKATSLKQAMDKAMQLATADTSLKHSLNLYEDEDVKADFGKWEAVIIDIDEDSDGGDDDVRELMISWRLLHGPMGQLGWSKTARYAYVAVECPPMSFINSRLDSAKVCKSPRVVGGGQREKTLAYSDSLFGPWHAECLPHHVYVKHTSPTGQFTCRLEDDDAMGISDEKET